MSGGNGRKGKVVRVFIIFFCLYWMDIVYCNIIDGGSFYCVLQYDVGKRDIELVVYFNYGVVCLRCFCFLVSKSNFVGFFVVSYIQEVVGV